MATFAARRAEQYKLEQTLMGEGEAARKAAVINADGALEAKLAAWVKAQEYWAAAFKDYSGAVVPSVVTGSVAGTGNAALDFMSLMGIKAAKDLSLDMGIANKSKSPQ